MQIAYILIKNTLPRVLSPYGATIISVLHIPQLLHNVSIEYILSPTGRVYIVRAALEMRYTHYVVSGGGESLTLRKVNEKGCP